MSTPPDAPVVAEAAAATPARVPFSQPIKRDDACHILESPEYTAFRFCGEPNHVHQTGPGAYASLPPRKPVETVRRVSTPALLEHWHPLIWVALSAGCITAV